MRAPSFSSPGCGGGGVIQNPLNLVLNLPRAQQSASIVHPEAEVASLVVDGHKLAVLPMLQHICGETERHISVVRQRVLFAFGFNLAKLMRLGNFGTHFKSENLRNLQVSVHVSTHVQPVADSPDLYYCFLLFFSTITLLPSLITLAPFSFFKPHDKGRLRVFFSPIV